MRGRSDSYVNGRQRRGLAHAKWLCQATCTPRRCGNCAGLRVIGSPFDGPSHGGVMSSFYEMLQEQRWDDHRLYHHNRINQSLHLLSSTTFVITYVLLFTYPVAG